MGELAFLYYSQSRNKKEPKGVKPVTAILILESIGLKPNAKSSNALKRVTFLARFSALELLACGFNHR